MALLLGRLTRWITSRAQPSNDATPASPVRDSLLYRDLERDHRDAIHRAMTFIAKYGGAEPPGNEEPVLVAHRDAARQWLLAQRDQERLVADYERFFESWSPVFPDYTPQRPRPSEP